MANTRPEEVLDGLPVARPFPRQPGLSLRVLEPGERTEEEALVQLLPKDLAHRREARRDAEAVRLEGHVEIEEVPSRSPVEDRVELRPEEAGHVQALAIHERREGVEDEDRDVDPLEPKVYGVRPSFEDLDLSPHPELAHEAFEILRVRHSEVDVAARTVGVKAPHRLAADHEPVRQVTDGAPDGRRDDVDGMTRHRHQMPLASAAASSRPRAFGRKPGSRSA